MLVLTEFVEIRAVWGERGCGRVTECNVCWC